MHKQKSVALTKVDSNVAGQPVPSIRVLQKQEESKKIKTSPPPPPLAQLSEDLTKNQVPGKLVSPAQYDGQGEDTLNNKNN